MPELRLATMADLDRVGRINYEVCLAEGLARDEALDVVRDRRVHVEALLNRSPLHGFYVIAEDVLKKGTLIVGCLGVTMARTPDDGPAIEMGNLFCRAAQDKATPILVMLHAAETARTLYGPLDVYIGVSRLGRRKGRACATYRAMGFRPLDYVHGEVLAGYSAPIDPAIEALRKRRDRLCPALATSCSR